MMSITITYDKESDQWVVNYSTGMKDQTRRYGSLKTMLGALEDIAPSIKTPKIKTK